MASWKNYRILLKGAGELEMNKKWKQNQLIMELLYSKHYQAPTLMVAHHFFYIANNTLNG